MNEQIEIRECATLEELASCVDLQRAVFALPEVELSPVRHFVVTKNAGGFTLGAFADNELIGFVLSVPAFLRGEKAFYSHMTAVKSAFQSYGIGARLKWAQRRRALAENVKFVKWTFEPIKARNAYFNLEKLGAIVSEYQPNFYGIDYSTASTGGKPIGLASDRLFAEWHLESEKVKRLAVGEKYTDTRGASKVIVIPSDWNELVTNDPNAAVAEQLRIRGEFQEAFDSKLIARSFRRDDSEPAFLLYND